ncbi:hypothetical protein Droror1_Dr00007171 [Drosera rotundifolia]
MFIRQRISATPILFANNATAFPHPSLATSIGSHPSSLPLHRHRHVLPPQPLPCFLLHQPPAATVPSSAGHQGERRARTWKSGNDVRGFFGHDFDGASLVTPSSCSLKRRSSIKLSRIGSGMGLAQQGRPGMKHCNWAGHEWSESLPSN